MPTVVRGNAITLDCLSTDSAGDPVDPTGLSVSIIDAFGATVVSLDTNVTIVATGHAQYEYTVPADAFPGAWVARWFGTIDGGEETDDDGFTVLGSITAGDGTTCTPWATHEDAPSSLQAYDIDPVEVDLAFQIAGDILFQLTGRRWPGRCSDVIRPQAQWSASSGPPRWWPAIGSRSSIWGWCSCNRSRETGCSRIPEIKLPGHPVDAASIVVTIDGEEFGPDTIWRLDDGRYLVRVDGEGWPCCQDLRADISEERTWQVAYSWGNGPDAGGIRAAALLGTQLFGDFFPDSAEACKLPKRAVRVTRAGTTVDLTSPKDMVEQGITGIPAVDLWVASKRLGQARRRATVLIPGKHRTARRTGV